VYAVYTADRVVAARLALVGESVVIVPSGGEREVEVIEGEWRDVVRGVAVVVIRRLLPSRPSSERPSRLPMSDMDDRELVETLRRGGREAVREIERRYIRAIKGAIERSSLPPMRQSEIGGIMLTKIRADNWWIVRRWNGAGSLLPYLARLVRWAFNDYARRAAGMQPGTEDLAGEDLLDSLPPGAMGPLEILRDRERMKAIERVVSELISRDQDLVYRRYVFEEETHDIADALRMSPSAIHVALHRARSRFEKFASGDDRDLLRPLIDRMATGT
jgi:RNA polymerase sigma factor (sigma-70 family)